MELWK